MGDIAKAELLLFELGNTNELLVLQFMPHSWYNKWENSKCAQFGIRALSEFFNSDFVHKDILDMHPNIRYILLMDMPNAIQLEDSSRFIRFTLSNAAQTGAHQSNEQHAVTFPPPFPIHKKNIEASPIFQDQYL